MSNFVGYVTLFVVFASLAIILFAELLGMVGDFFGHSQGRYLPVLENYAVNVIVMCSHIGVLVLILTVIFYIFCS